VKAAFQRIAGHPALDLVNTLDWRFGTREPEDLLATYSDLLRFTEQSGLLTAKQARPLRHMPGARALDRSRDLRETLAAILYARLDGQNPPPSSLAALERFFQAARAAEKLRWKQGRLEWEWNEGGAELPLRALALSASTLMLSGDLERVRACNNPECRWLFLDTSKNHTRRWCDMKLCGNRMKARRFKAQRKGRENGSPLDGLPEL